MSTKQLIKEAEQDLDTEFRIRTPQGIKTSASLYRSFYKEIKELEAARDEWHGRVKEAVFRLGLPTPQPNDKVKITIVKVGGKVPKTLRQIQKELAEDSPALMALLDLADHLYETQERSGGEETIRITDK